MFHRSPENHNTFHPVVPLVHHLDMLPGGKPQNRRSFAADPEELAFAAAWGKDGKAQLSGALARLASEGDAIGGEELTWLPASRVVAQAWPACSHGDPASFEPASADHDITPVYFEHQRRPKGDLFHLFLRFAQSVFQNLRGLVDAQQARLGLGKVARDLAG